ncbi:MAG: arginase [Pseudomonadota bacterium]
MIKLIAAASGIAAADHGCADGPKVLQQSQYLDPLNYEWVAEITSVPQKNKKLVDVVARWCSELALQTQKLTQNDELFCVIGGDHSSAIGTWSGVVNALGQQQPLGLIWIDAHLDAHTFETTETGMIHGMPLAALLGFGDSKLTQIANLQPKFKAENICIIGARSFESGEYHLLQSQGVKIYYMDEVRNLGFASIFAEAVGYLSKRTQKFALSLDLDGIDPLDAPGVGTPVANGIAAAAVLSTLTNLAKQPNFIGMEITEFNPHRDKKHKTEQLIARILDEIFVCHA